MYETPKLHTHMGGYETIRYKTEDGPVNVKHHRLIAVAEYGFDAVANNAVHHKNRAKWDNRASNIEVLTDSDHGEIHAPDRGPDRRKLTLDQEIEIYERYHTTDDYQDEIAEDYDVTQRTISSVVNATGHSLLSEHSHKLDLH